MEEALAKQLGLRIKILRKKANLSQEQMAEMIGSHPVHLSKIERGVTNMGLDLLEKTAFAFGMTPSRLLSIPDEPEPIDTRREIDAMLDRANDKDLKLIFRIVDMIVN